MLRVVQIQGVFVFESAFAFLLNRVSCENN